MPIHHFDISHLLSGEANFQFCFNPLTRRVIVRTNWMRNYTAVRSFTVPPARYPENEYRMVLALLMIEGLIDNEEASFDNGAIGRYSAVFHAKRILRKAARFYYTRDFVAKDMVKGIPDEALPFTKGSALQRFAFYAVNFKKGQA